MLKNIPTHVIAGPLGAGKTSLIRHLLTQKPAHERWAVLVNEFGQIGLDAALLERDEAGVAIGEVAGGCLCCVNGAPFQVGLGRLLRKIGPDRLFIEPSGLGHPQQLMAQLRSPPWRGVLAVQPLLMVLDAEALGRGDALPRAQVDAMAEAAAVVLNKSASVDEATRLLITAKLPAVQAIWTDQGRVNLHRLPVSAHAAGRAVDVLALPVDSRRADPPALWTKPEQPIIHVHQADSGWSIGWRWHPSRRFDDGLMKAVLAGWPWLRSKGVIHSMAGWQSFNGLRGGAIEWRVSEWRKDSRIELIFDAPQPHRDVTAAMARCLVDN